MHVVSIFMFRTGTYYDIDDNGWILADNRGNLVISDLKGLMDVYMLRNMFTNWKRVPYEDKRVLQDILNERYFRL